MIGFGLFKNFIVIESNRNIIEKQRKVRINAKVIKMPGFNSVELGFIKIFPPTIKKAIDNITHKIPHITILPGVSPLVNQFLVLV